MKFLKYLGYAIAALVVLAGVAWLLRADPMGPLSGKMLSGAEQPYPDDWSVVDSHPLCALETRVDDPHSVTPLRLDPVGHEEEPPLFSPASDPLEGLHGRFLFTARLGDRRFRGTAPQAGVPTRCHVRDVGD